ncbi:MAG: hypothetical protein AAF411_15750, partial [Myxococcota bacterium]
MKPVLLALGFVACAGSASAQLARPGDIARSLATASERVQARDNGFILGLDGGASILTALAEDSNRSLTIQFSLYGGYRYQDWGFLIFAEQALWKTAGVDGESTFESALNVGLGVERFHRSGFLRTQLRVGASILTRANELDPVGTTGFFA